MWQLHLKQTYVAITFEIKKVLTIDFDKVIEKKMLCGILF